MCDVGGVGGACRDVVFIFDKLKMVFLHRFRCESVELVAIDENGTLEPKDNFLIHQALQNLRRVSSFHKIHLFTQPVNCFRSDEALLVRDSFCSTQSDVVITNSETRGWVLHFA